MLGPVPAAALAALTATIAVATPAPPVEVPATGPAIYQRDCAWCHGPAGAGSSRGVSLLEAGGASAHYYLSTGRMPIADPTDPIRRGEVGYSEVEIDALVTYVASLGDGPPVPALEVAGGDLALGGRLFRQHCAQCHGSAGVGVALAFDVVAPSVLSSTPIHVAEAMLIGPGAMPVFTGATFDEAEARSVVRYVEALQHEPDHGGFPFARSGRLDELLVAWVFGIGLLLLCVRWIARAR